MLSAWYIAIYCNGTSETGAVVFQNAGFQRKVSNVIITFGDNFHIVPDIWHIHIVFDKSIYKIQFLTETGCFAFLNCSSVSIPKATTNKYLPVKLHLTQFYLNWFL